jgi:hypothetical protein
MNRRHYEIAGVCGAVCLVFGVGFLVVRREIGVYALLNLGGAAVGGGLFFFYYLRDLARRNLAVRSQSSRRFIWVTAATLAALLLLNLFSHLFYTGFDLTQDKVSSLSDQSRKAVQWIKEPVELLVFSTRAVPDSVHYLLDSYAFINKNISYRFVDPEKNPQLAQRYKVDQEGQVVLSHGEGFILIPSADEQSLTNAILKLTQKMHNTVYFMAGHGERDLNDVSTKEGAGLLAQQMRNENYEAAPLVLEPPHYYVPGNCTLLVIAGPRKAYTEFELKAVREYLAASGRAMFLLDPQVVTGVEPLLAQWGIELRRDVVLDIMFPSIVERALAGMRGKRALPRPLLQVYVKDFPEHPITTDLQGKSAILSITRSLGALKSKNPTAHLNVEVLAETTDKGWAETDVEGLMRDGLVSRALDEKPGPYPVALLATLGKETDNSKIIVFGDSDFISNEFIHQLHNMDLFMNSLAYLGEQTPLVSVRPRHLFASRLDYKPETMTRIFTLSVLVFPQLLLMAGLAFWRFRR